MNEDFSNLITKFSEILKDKDIDLGKIADESTSSAKTTDTTDFSLDIDTILKIKQIMSKLGQNADSPRNKLLLALKPYLTQEKVQKLDTYIKFANILTILENDSSFQSSIMNLDEKKGYDHILIITLFLLILSDYVYSDAAVPPLRLRKHRSTCRGY